MTLGQWLLLIFAGVFTLVMLVSLVGFLVRLFARTRPHRRRRR